MNKKSDDFANIAAAGISAQGKELYAPEPQNIEIKPLPISADPKQERIAFPKKMDTKEELYEELELWKERYKPFLSRQAPKINNYREKQAILTFDWKIEDEADRKNIKNIFEGV